jgi:hypothetical protein
MGFELRAFMNENSTILKCATQRRQWIWKWCWNSKTHNSKISLNTVIHKFYLVCVCWHMWRRKYQPDISLVSKLIFQQHATIYTRESSAYINLLSYFILILISLKGRAWYCVAVNAPSASSPSSLTFSMCLMRQAWKIYKKAPSGICQLKFMKLNYLSGWLDSKEYNLILLRKKNYINNNCLCWRRWSERERVTLDELYF